MPSSYRVYRGVDIKGWKVHQPKEIEEIEINNSSSSKKGSRAEYEKELREREEEKKALIEEAYRETEEQRQEMLKKAEEEAAALKDEAYKEGYDKGYSKGEKEAEKLKEEGERLLQEARQRREEIIDGAEEEIVQLALSIAEKLLGCKVEMDRECLLSVIYRCLDNLPGGASVLVRLHPVDMEIFDDNLQKIKGFLKKDVELNAVADEKLPRGSCRVESEEAEVEAHLQKELKMLGERLLQIAASPADAAKI